jgi:uncharacterized membrane protein
MASVAAHFRTRITRGLLLLLPLFVTVWVLRILFGLVEDSVGPWLRRILGVVGVEGLDRWPASLLVPITALVLTVLFVYALGVVAGNFLGRRFLGAVEAGILRVPVVKGIYGAARQLLDALSVSSKRPFSRVVLVEFPRPGCWTVGFVTGQAEHSFASGAGGQREPCVPVFVPTTPNPTSGWLLFVPKREVHDVDLTTEQALKLVVSGGLVSPADLGTLVRMKAPRSAPSP